MEESNVLRGSGEPILVHNIDGNVDLALSSSHCELTPQHSPESCCAWVPSGTASEVDGAIKPSFDAVPYSAVDDCGWFSMCPLLWRCLTHFALAVSCGGVMECCLLVECAEEPWPD
ncbi:hypothetical protein Nepgr_030039 [Nepenthes gracilis]|uniref:Uncharacterized protein n=1 Tax=Nepenthes gracilis TaxID=150966 RepID=A0AAD3TFG8_NEPGR|nr:hypothetical protein Nepgr_030039 [Nepenthes gracilis]